MAEAQVLEDRARALHRDGGRAAAAACERPAAVAGALPRRRRGRMLLPAPPHHGAQSRAPADRTPRALEQGRIHLCRPSRGAGQRGAKRRRRVPYLGCDRARHPASRPHHHGSRSRREAAVEGAGGRHASHEIIAGGPGPEELPQNHRRQGPARGRADRAEAWLGRGEGVHPAHCPDAREGAAGAFHGEDLQGKPAQQDLRRLPAQFGDGERDSRLFAARTPQCRRIHAAALERARPEDRPAHGVRRAQRRRATER